MGDIEQYRPQVSPELPKGPSPFELIAGFHPPDTQIESVVAEGLTSIGNRVAELALKAQAADQAQEVAQAQAQYFAAMKKWTFDLPQSELDPKEYQNEFSRKSTEVASEISKGFRYADSLEQFSTWRTEQDVPLLGETVKQQLTAMNDRFGAALQKGFALLNADPDYEQTLLGIVDRNEWIIGKAAAEQDRQLIRNHADLSRAMTDGAKIGSAAMVERLKDPKYLVNLTPEQRQGLPGDLYRNENIQAQGLAREDEAKNAHFANDVLPTLRKPSDYLKARAELQAAPFHDGDLTLKWWKLLTPPDPDQAKAWSQLPPDDATYAAWSVLKSAVRFNRSLPNDPAYGRYAGQFPNSAFAREWILGNQKQMGNAFKSESEAIDDLESERYKYADQKMEDLFNSDVWKNKYRDAKESYYAQAALRQNIHLYIDRENPDEQKLSAAIYANTLRSLKPITEDAPSRAQGAEFALRLWNRQIPTWADGGAQQNEVDKLANAEKIDFAARYGLKPEDLPRLTGKPQAGEQGYRFLNNGVAVFSFDGNAYAYVPADYDPTKKTEEQTFKAREMKLKVWKGGRWMDPPEPLIDTSGPTTLSAKDLAGKYRNDLINTRNDLLDKIDATERFITDQTEAVKTNPMLRPSLRQKQHELDVYRRDLANVEATIKQKGIRP